MVTLPYTAFNGGEVSPDFFGRIDQQRYFTSAKTMEGFIARELGAATARGGNAFVAEVKDSSKKVLLVKFVFSNVDPYVIEIGDLYMRFYRSRGQIVDPAKTITGATQANPVVVTAASHGYSNGEHVNIDSVVGMTELNGRRFTVANQTTNTFELSGIDGTGFTAYSSGGEATLIFEIASPYAEADLFDSNGLPNLHFAQSGDILFLAHPDFVPRQLKRFADTNWELDTFEPGVGPFKDENTTTTTITWSSLGAAKTITGIAKGIPPVVTSTSHGLSDGEFVLIEGVVGMTEVNDNRFKVANVTTNTFELEGVDASLYTAYTSGGTAKELSDTVSASGTLTADSPTFTADDVGSHMLMRLTNFAGLEPWQTLERYAAGTLIINNGLIYEAINTGESGAEPPAHTEGSQWDGPTRIETLEQAKTVTAVTKANPGVATSNGHGFNNDDEIQFGTVTGMTEISDRRFAVSDALTNTFQLRGEDTTSYGTFSGTVSASRVKLSNIQWRFVGSGFAVFDITGFTSTTVVAADVVKDATGFTGSAETAWRKAAWSTVEGNPRTVELHEERLVWAGTAEQPLTAFFSSTFDLYDHSPFDTDGSVSDSTAFNRSLNSNNPIRWLKSIDKGILVGTIGGEWLITTSSLSDALTPATAQAKQFAEFGTSSLPPERVGEAALYLEFSRKKIQEIVFDLDVSQMLPQELTEGAEHIFDSSGIWCAWAGDPYRVLWVGREDGTITGLTYNRNKEVKVKGWHNHTIAGTDAAVETAVAIPSPDTSVSDLWQVVKRTINGGTKRYVEFMTQPEISGTGGINAFTDSTLTYDGVATSTISGLWHLVGEEVRAVVDGANHNPVTVAADGTITLDFPGSVVHVGLYETKILETLPAEFESDVALTSQGKRKRFKKVKTRVIDSLGGHIGSDADNMDPIIYDETTMDAAPALFSGIIEQVMPGFYAEDALIRWEQRDPLPMSIAAAFGEI